jgi:hypothetical protein
VSGSGAPITLVGGRGSVLARAVEALARFPDDGQWVLVGGLAVFVRLGSITRPTADADTVARSQASLIEVLRANDVGLVVGGGEVQVTVGGGVVEVDVMDLSDNPLPRDVERRAFALARRFALSSARLEQVVVVESDGAVVATATIPVATAAALGALKTVSMVRRPHGNHRRRLDPTSAPRAHRTRVGGTVDRPRSRCERRGSRQLGGARDRARVRQRPSIHARPPCATTIDPPVREH